MLAGIVKNICERRLGSNPALQKSTKEGFVRQGANKMVQPEFRDLVFELAKRLSDVPEVRSLILFGSVTDNSLRRCSERASSCTARLSKWVPGG